MTWKSSEAKNMLNSVSVLIKDASMFLLNRFVVCVIKRPETNAEVVSRVLKRIRSVKLKPRIPWRIAYCQSFIQKSLMSPSDESTQKNTKLKKKSTRKQTMTDGTEVLNWKLSPVWEPILLTLVPDPVQSLLSYTYLVWLHSSPQVLHPFVSFCCWTTGETFASCGGRDLQHSRRPKKKLQ